jgi:hypothetical protein
MAIRDTGGEERDAGDRAEDTSTVDEIAGIIGGSMMAGGSGSPGDTRTSTGPVGSAGGASIAGMSARDLTEDESVLPADPDADASPGAYEGAGATDLGDRPINRDEPKTPQTLIAAEDEDQAAV